MKKRKKNQNNPDSIIIIITIIKLPKPEQKQNPPSYFAVGDFRSRNKYSGHDTWGEKLTTANTRGSEFEATDQLTDFVGARKEKEEMRTTSLAYTNCYN